MNYWWIPVTALGLVAAKYGLDYTLWQLFPYTSGRLELGAPIYYDLSMPSSKKNK